MIISKTPYRFSFFGGGLDFPEWYKDHETSVACCALDYYAYISFNELEPFFPEYRHRVAYSKLEYVMDIDAIKHPSVRACLKHFDVNFGCDIHHRGDLPAQSGVGTSSAFTVGLVNALSNYLGKNLSRDELARKSIFLEREVMKEAVGIQDQIASSYGGFVRISALGNSFKVRPMGISDEYISYLADNILIGFTGTSRVGVDISRSRLQTIDAPAISNLYHELHSVSVEGIRALESEKEIDTLGPLLDESWRLKKRSHDNEDMSLMDDLLSRAKMAGALGGKLMGAGNHGFFYLLVSQKNRLAVMEGCRNFYKNLRWIPTKFAKLGSTVIHRQPR